MDFSGVQYVKIELDKLVKEDKKQKKKEKKRLKKVCFLVSPRTVFNEAGMLTSLYLSTLPVSARHMTMAH